MDSLELKLNQLCNKCQQIPGCSSFCRGCKGRCPMLVGILLFSLAILGVELGIWMPQQIEDSKFNYLNSISSSPTCQSYCGQSWRAQEQAQDNCCSREESQCRNKKECYRQQLKTYENSQLTCKVLFFCSFGFLCLYIPYYFLRCLFRIRQDLDVEASEQLEPLNMDNSQMFFGNQGASGVGGAVDRLPPSQPYRNSMEGCPICLQGFDGPQRVIRLQCDHIFHSECIRSWMEGNRQCPLCRAQH